MGYAVFFIALLLFIKLWPWKKASYYQIIRVYGFDNLFFSFYIMTLQTSIIFICLQLIDFSADSSYNITSYVCCCAFTLYHLGMLIFYFMKSLKIDVISLTYKSFSKFYVLAFFHKLPMLKYKITKQYGTLWIIYKLIFPFLLYYDLKKLVIILSLVNPISMFAMDTF